jgi:hypothetical protein
MNNCNWFFKKRLTNICHKTYWLILPIKFKLIIPLAIFLCHWRFHRQNTDDIFYWWFCRGGSKQFITLCNFLMKMLIIYRHNFFRSINKINGKNAIKQFLNGIKQHQTINLNWRKKQLQMSIKINYIEEQNFHTVKINCKCIYKSITSSSYKWKGRGRKISWGFIGGRIMTEEVCLMTSDSLLVPDYGAYFRDTTTRSHILGCRPLVIEIP